MKIVLPPCAQCARYRAVGGRGVLRALAHHACTHGLAVFCKRPWAAAGGMAGKQHPAPLGCRLVVAMEAQNSVLSAHCANTRDTPLRLVQHQFRLDVLRVADQCGVAINIRGPTCRTGGFAVAARQATRSGLGLMLGMMTDFHASCLNPSTERIFCAKGRCGVVVKNQAGMAKSPVQRFQKHAAVRSPAA